jgi:polar amino acid transport system substrate-binding protein
MTMGRVDIRKRAVTLAALVALLALLCSAPAEAQDGASDSRGKLVVGTMRVPPFVLRADDGQWSGLSVDLWKQIAAELNKEFEFREFDYDPAGLLQALEQRQLDLAVGAIPLTVEGETRFDFSHPYFATGLGIAVRAEPQTGVLAMLAGLFTPRLFGTVAGLLALLLLVGVLVWLLERRQSAGQFDKRPMHGIGDGLWWAAVTMTTTGYGDKVPVGWKGRALGIVWMYASVILLTFFSASLASSFVVNRLKTGVTGPADLPRARIAVVAGSSGEPWLASQGLRGRSFPFVIQASKALQRGEVDALIYERPILGHMIKQYGWRDLEILPHVLAVHDYAIAMPSESAMKEPVNRALLKVVHAPQWKDVVQRYVGAADK